MSTLRLAASTCNLHVVADVVGIQAVRSVLSEDAGRARCLYLLRGRRDGRINELIGLARGQGVRYQTMDRAWFDKRVAEVNHQGVVLDCHALELADEAQLQARWPELPANPLLLVLDGVTDPRNLGACLRAANGAGVNAVILPKRQTAPINELVIKTAQGGVEGLLIVNVTNLARTLRWLREQGVWLIGADGEASTRWSDVDVTGPSAILMGGEAKGLRRLTKEHCDQLVSLPMAGSVASLNVSVATGILLYEAVRQRQSH